MDRIRNKYRGMARLSRSKMKLVRLFVLQRKDSRYTGERILTMELPDRRKRKTTDNIHGCSE